MTMEHAARLLRVMKAGAWSLLLAATLPATAQAALLRIDSSTSYVRPAPALIFCFTNARGEMVCPEPEPQTYALSGTISVETRPWGDPRLELECIVITAIELTVGSWTRSFMRSPREGILEDGRFWANDSGCWTMGVMGESLFCLASPDTTVASGSWDGEWLALTGSGGGYFGGFVFLVDALAVPVPEPPSLALTLGLLPWVAWRAGRKRLRPRQG